MLWQRYMPEPGGIVVAKPVSPIVAPPSILRLRGHRFDLAGVRAEAHVAAADGNHLAGRERFHPAAAVTVGSVNPAVESPLEAVEAMLLVARVEAGEQNLAHVRTVIAIGVLGVEQIRCGGYEHALSPRHHAGRKRHAFQE